MSTYEENYDPDDWELGTLDMLRAMDPEGDSQVNPLPDHLKIYAGHSRPCMKKPPLVGAKVQETGHLACRGLSRRSCTCKCHKENRDE